MTSPTSNFVNTVATGGASNRSFIEIFLPRDPTSNDISGTGGQYQVQQRWWNTSTNHEWILVGYSSTGGVVSANWQSISGLSLAETLTGNTGGAVSPDSSNNINVVGDGTSVTVTGSPGTNTLTISLVGGGIAIDSLIPNSGTSPVVPNGSGAITLQGTGSITTVGGTNSLTPQLTGLTDHAVLVGAGTATITKVLLTNQQILTGNTGADPSGKSLSVVRQVFTGSGTYTPTAGMLYCDIEVIGGGGGGGATTICGAAEGSAGGGGGSGGYTRRIVSAATIGASQTVTIGAAGTAGAVSGGSGGTGGTSSVGVLASCTGGIGGNGAGAGATAQLAEGGAGGVGSGGDFSTNGMPGAFGFSSGGATSIAWSGGGGSVFFGGGAKSVSSGAGTTASSYGGGGSGGATNPNGAAVAGGAGFAGLVVVTEYVLA